MRPPFLLTPLILAAGAATAATEFGKIEVRQINGGNESSSAALTRGRGSSAGFTITGGNRADYNVSFGNADDPAAGILISSPAQNSRDDSAVGGPSEIPHQATTAVQVSGTRYYIPVFRSPHGDEANLNVSAAFFPYSNWLGGVTANETNGGRVTSLTGSPGLVLGTHFTESSTVPGQYGLNLSSLVASASQNGVLLVCGAKNEDNFALSRANANGTFTIHCHDNGNDGDDHEPDPVAFVYLPKSSIGTDGLTALGRVNGDASTDVSAGTFIVTKAGTGKWKLVVTGHSDATGTLIVSPEGGDSNNVDNIVSAEWDADNGWWIITSRDLPNATLQNMSEASEDAFSFAFFARTTATGSPPATSLTSPANQSAFTVGESTTLSATASDDGSIDAVRFYAGDRLLAEDRVPPYQFQWNQLPPGVHDLNARSTDDLGFVTRSNTRIITVTPPPGIGGLFFDGEDDHVIFPADPLLNPSIFTIECWFRVEEGSAGTDAGGITAIPLVARGRDESGTGANYFLGIDSSSGRLTADFKGNNTEEDQTLVGTTVVPKSTWQHAAATFDGSSWKIYLNGNLEASAETYGESPLTDSTQRLSLGTALNTSGTPGGRLLGTMDEVRVWNRARTPQEIRTGLNQQITVGTGLALRCGMNETSGTTLQNSASVSIPGTLVNGVFRTAGAPFDLDTPPDATPLYPSHGQAGVPRTTALTVATGDPENAPVTVRYFGRSTASGALQDFSIIALPDTQFYSENTGGNLARIFSAQTDWIVSQRTARNIAGVLHLGDITQRGDNPSTAAAEWSNAAAAMYRLEDPDTTQLAHGIPYSMAVGNHDQTPIGTADGTTINFNTRFGVHPTTGRNHFRNKSYYGGTSVPDSADNNYILISSGGIDLIVISFEFDTSPDDEDLEWADALLKAHPTRCGIVTTHWTVGTGNPASFSAQGRAIYDSLKDNPNLIFLHGGHIAGEGRRSDTFQGRTVHSLLADYQGRTNGGDGWLRILKFRPSLNRIDIQTYSPTLNRFETDADSQFTIPVDLAGRGQPFTEIGSVTTTNGQASFQWNSLALATRYEWYAETSDGLSVTRSPVTSFTTTGTVFPPTSSINAPSNGSVWYAGNAIPIQVSANDTDGQVTAVRYYSGTTLLGQTTSAPHVFTWNNAPVGTHTIIAKAVDNEDLEGAAMPVEIRVVPKPIVTVTASDASASEYGEDRIFRFDISRGATTGNLSVHYLLSGIAAAGSDYNALPGVAEIIDGQSSVSIDVTALADDLPEGRESVILSISENPDYQLGLMRQAQAWIEDRPLHAWMHQQQITSAARDDDQDGVKNLVEYFMGTRADRSSEASTVRAVSSSSGTFIATFPRSKAAVDVTGDIEWSSDLTNWRASGQSNGSQTATISTRAVSPEAEDPETLEATATITDGPQPAAFFLRLNVRSGE